MMKNIVVLIALILITNDLFGQTNRPYKIDCVQLSNVKYLIVIENDSNESIFIPTKPVVQKSNDTLFVDRRFSYKHCSSTLYKYNINGIAFSVNTPLNSNIKPIVVSKEANGFIPNYAVPSPLFELKPRSVHTFIVANSYIETPRTIAFSIFHKKDAIDSSSQIIIGAMVPIRMLSNTDSVSK